MKILALLLCAFSMTACEPYKAERPTPSQQYSQSVSSASSVASVAPVMQSVVIAHHISTEAAKLKGMDWLRAIGTKKITGTATQAFIDVEISRGPENDGKGWSAIGAYIAPLAQGEGFSYPDESKYGKSLHFLKAQWIGNCKRNLSPSNSFGVIKGALNSTTVDLSSVYMTTGDDGCNTAQSNVDLLAEINDGGLVIGFMPSDPSYRVKVTLRYVGDLKVSDL